MEIDDVKPDDVKSAVAFAKQAMKEGWWDGDWGQALLNKQTDSAKLRKALSEIKIGDEED